MKTKLFIPRVNFCGLSTTQRREKGELELKSRLICLGEKSLIICFLCFISPGPVSILSDF